jgi:glycosyltransferase involved in cell wall biosynthesis
MRDAFPKVLLFPHIEKDGIGTYIRGLDEHLTFTKLAFAGNILGPRQMLARLPSGFDVIHVPHFLVPFSARGAKVVCTIQDIIPLFNRETPFLHKLYLQIRIAWSLKRADHIIFTSNATYSEVVRKFGAVKRHSIIPLACDEPLPTDGSPRPHAFPYFFHVGRRREHKNVPAIIHALAGPGLEACHLVLGGRREDADESLMSLAENLGMAERIHFSGFLSREQLAAHYRHAEALVFPSLREGFGIPILEAMSYSCPVITSDLSSMPEVAGGGALLVNPTDPSAISGAMRRVLDEKGLKDALRESGRLNWKRYSWKSTAEKTRNLYLELSQSREKAAMAK